MTADRDGTRSGGRGADHPVRVTPMRPAIDEETGDRMSTYGMAPLGEHDEAFETPSDGGFDVHRDESAHRDADGAAGGFGSPSAERSDSLQLEDSCRGMLPDGGPMVGAWSSRTRSDSRESVPARARIGGDVPAVQVVRSSSSGDTAAIRGSGGDDPWRRIRR